MVTVWPIESFSKSASRPCASVVELIDTLASSLATIPVGVTYVDDPPYVTLSIFSDPVALNLLIP